MANDGGQSTMLAAIKLLRPAQWVKNTFVLAPLLFSQKFHNTNACIKTLAAFAVFCAASSAVYIFNDLCDRKEDREHPVKKHRPLASGLIGVAPAIVLLLILAGVAGGGGVLLGKQFLAMLVVFLGVNAAYSLKLKHVVILDVMLISFGFVLRIMAGSFAIGVKPSHWLVLCTAMISLFLGFAKRRTELVSAGESPQSRLVLKEYSLGFLDQAIAMMTGITIVCYVLYTIDFQTEAMFGTHDLVLTVPFVVYGLFRYLYLVYHRHQGEDPSLLAMKDPFLLINLVLWVLACFVIIRYATKIPDPFY